MLGAIKLAYIHSTGVLWFRFFARTKGIFSRRGTSGGCTVFTVALLYSKIIVEAILLTRTLLANLTNSGAFGYWCVVVAIVVIVCMLGVVLWRRERDLVVWMRSRVCFNLSPMRCNGSWHSSGPSSQHT